MTREIRNCSILFLAVLALANACTAAGGTVKPEVRTISSGGYSQAESTSAFAVFDQKTYETRWNETIGNGDRPAVDFSKESVVFLFAGMRTSGGYSIEVRGATLENETLMVDAVIHGPPAGSMVTQAITMPYAVVAVSGAKFSEVVWKP
jgi:hypothetical protein